MPNDNYCVALTAFSEANAGAYYVSPSVPAFNEVLTPGGGFAAYATFIMRGDIQNATGALNQFLWGNLDANRGWAIAINQGNEAQTFLQAIVGDGSGVNVAQYRLTSDPNADPAYVGANPIERLIMAGLWYSGTNLFLTINGCIVAVAEDIDHVASLEAARIGLNPDGAEPANVVDIVSVGYSSNLDLAAVGADLAHESIITGGLAGSAFSAARDTWSSGPINRDIGLDWVRRYDTKLAAEGSVGTLSKSVVGTRIAQRPASPSPLPDIGNQTYAPALPYYTPVTVTPVDLTRVAVSGQGFSLPQVIGRKNVDWFAGGTPIVPVAVVP